MITGRRPLREANAPHIRHAERDDGVGRRMKRLSSLSGDSTQALAFAQVAETALSA